MRYTRNTSRKNQAIVLVALLATICGASANQAIAGNNDGKVRVASTEPVESLNSSITSRDQKKKKKEKRDKISLAESTVRTEVKAPPELIYDTLTNFDLYPKIFNRIKTCSVTKREGDLVYVETYLKPQMFVKEQCQHTINDLKSRPSKLEWTQLDGNFKHLDGTWEIRPMKDGSRSEVVYTLRLDAGSVVPPQMVAFLLKFVQKEITGQLRSYVEHNNETRLTYAKNAN